ncbi:MAG: glycoside hydrolase family 57 protein [Acetivibrionales bacterium]
MTKGYVALVLHAHLPFVRHPENEQHLEERWLFEAISETYIPLLEYFELLIHEGVRFSITMSITPPLLSMLSDPLLQNRYVKYLEKLIELSEKEVERTKYQHEFHNLALMYNEKYKNDLYLFKEKYKSDLIRRFKLLQDEGYLELIACAATHGFLPLLTVTPGSIKAQINIGVKTHQRFFGKKPEGFWLPECGYVAEIENNLYNCGIQYIITESHGILFANPRPIFGTYSPIVSPNGIVAFGRDTESSKQVWSSKEGYPGDFDYREFYRDIGFDLDYEYIKDYISPDGQRIHTGIKYYRITGKSGDKKPYNPKWARNKAEIHAGNFMFNREKQIEYLSGKMDRPPIVVCPYDAELFGHWWYEGPYWLYTLIKKAYYDQQTFRLISLSEYIHRYPIMQLSAPSPSTWGYKGYNEVWLNASNDWIYKHLHKAAERMVELARGNPSATGLKRDALNQAARELLLAQSSDWAFIMKTGTMVQYAEKRTKDHIGRFTKLYYEIMENNIDENWLRDIETKDNIFPDIDYREYLS